MANFGSAFGFVPFSTTDGADYHGKMRDITIDDTTASFVGDFMSGDTNVAADQNRRLQTSIVADDASELVGALVEIFPDFTDEGSLISNFAPAGGGDRQGRVVYGSDVLYEVREDAVGAALDGADIGLAVDMTVATAGDTITGISGQALDSSFTPTAVGQFLLHRLGQQSNNVFAITGGIGAVWQVSINPGAT